MRFVVPLFLGATLCRAGDITISQISCTATAGAQTTVPDYSLPWPGPYFRTDVKGQSVSAPQNVTSWLGVAAAASQSTGDYSSTASASANDYASFTSALTDQSFSFSGTLSGSTSSSVASALGSIDNLSAEASLKGNAGAVFTEQRAFRYTIQENGPVTGSTYRATLSSDIFFPGYTSSLVVNGSPKFTGLAPSGPYFVDLTDLPYAGGAGGTASFQLSVQTLPYLHVFAAGVNWPDHYPTNLPLNYPPFYKPNPYGGYYGGVGANKFYNAMQSLPSFAVDGSIALGLNATSSSASNLNTINTSFATFSQRAWNDLQATGQNDAIVIYLATHGGNGTLELSKDGGDLTSAELHQMLMELPTQANKVVILDSCHSGSFSSALNGISNASLLAACGANSTTPYEDTIVMGGDGAGDFTDGLVSAIGKGVTDLSALTSYLTQSPYVWGNGNLVSNGQGVPLEEDPGTIVPWLGPIDPQLVSTSDFNGDLLGPPSSQVPEPNAAFLVGALALGSNLCRRRGSRSRDGNVKTAPLPV